MDHDLRKTFFKELEKEIRLLIDDNTGKLSDKFSEIINCPVCNATECVYICALC